MASRGLKRKGPMPPDARELASCSKFFWRCNEHLDICIFEEALVDLLHIVVFHPPTATERRIRLRRERLDRSKALLRAAVVARLARGEASEPGPPRVAVTRARLRVANAVFTARRCKQ